jgi:hypothetical protein
MQFYADLFWGRSHFFISTTSFSIAARRRRETIKCDLTLKAICRKSKLLEAKLNWNFFRLFSAYKVASQLFDFLVTVFKVGTK